MAIDPTIALGIRPVESPLDSYGKALGVQNMQNQNTLANLGIQKEQTALTTQKNMNDAIQQSIDPSTGLVDYNKVGQKLAALGSGSAVPGVMKQGYEVDQERVKSASQKMAFNMDNVGREFFGVAGMPAPTKADAMTALQRVIQGGFLDPAHAQDFATALANAPEDPNAIRAIALKAANGAVDLKTQFERANPKTTTQMVGGQIVPVTTTQATGQVTAGAPVTSAPTTDLAKINADEKAGLLSPSDAAAARRKATYIAPSPVAIYQQEAQNKNFDPTQALSPAEEAQARMIADGGKPMTPSSRNPRAMYVNARAQQLFADANGGDASGFGSLNKTLGAARTSFAAGGKNGQTLIALDTAVHHFDALGKTVDALNNGDTRALNAAGNYLSTQFGDPKVTNFETVKTLAADEFTKVAAGVTSGEAEREKMQQLFSSANSPAQLKQAIHQAQILMAGKVQGMDQQYKAAFGAKHSIMERVSDPTKAAMSKAEGVQTPSGLTNLHTNGKQTIGWDGSKWVDTTTGQEVK